MSGSLIVLDCKSQCKFSLQKFENPQYNTLGLNQASDGPSNIFKDWK